MPQGTHQPEGEEHTPAAIIADHVQWQHRLLRRADGVNCPRKRHIIGIVARDLRQRPLLPPAGHSRVDQPRIAREGHVGAQPQPFHHPGPEPLDQRIRHFNQAQHRRHPIRRLEIEYHRASPALQHRVRRWPGSGPVDTQDIRAAIRKQHRRKGPRPKAGNLEDFDPGQRPATRIPILCHVHSRNPAKTNSLEGLLRACQADAKRPLIGARRQTVWHLRRQALVTG